MKQTDHSPASSQLAWPCMATEDEQSMTGMCCNMLQALRTDLQTMPSTSTIRAIHMLGKSLSPTISVLFVIFQVISYSKLSNPVALRRTCSLPTRTPGPNRASPLGQCGVGCGDLRRSTEKTRDPRSHGRRSWLEPGTQSIFLVGNGWNHDEAPVCSCIVTGLALSG